VDIRRKAHHGDAGPSMHHNADAIVLPTYSLARPSDAKSQIFVAPKRSMKKKTKPKDQFNGLRKQG